MPRPGAAPATGVGLVRSVIESMPVELKNRGGRAQSPERRRAEEAAARFIEGRRGPTPTREILVEMQRLGIKIGGTIPQNNLSAQLSNAKGFKSHGRSGWTYAPERTNEQAADGRPGKGPSAASFEPGLTSRGTHQH